MNNSSPRQDPLAEVVTLLSAPLAGGLRAVDQVFRGTDELLKTVENLNKTLRNLNETSERVNALLADIEEPIRAAMPQLLRTIRTADELTQMMEGPMRAAAPTIGPLMQTLSSPSLAKLPAQLGEFMSTMSEMSSRLGPLTQMAENASGLFGSLRIPGIGAGQRSSRNEPRPTADTSIASPGDGRIERTSQPTETDERAATKTAKKPAKSPSKKTPKASETAKAGKTTKAAKTSKAAKSAKSARSTKAGQSTNTADKRSAPSAGGRAETKSPAKKIDS